MKLLQSLLFATVVTVLLAAPASAASIGGVISSCVTCQGATYTLDIDLASSDLNFATDHTFDSYVVKLTIDTSTYSGQGVRIDEVAVKISDSYDLAQLTSTTAPGVWLPVAGGIGNNGCTGSGSGFECADWKTNSSAGAAVGGVYSWVFTIDISTPLYSFLATDPNLLPVVKARYVDDSNNKVGAIVSEKVPEPGTLALLGIGATIATIRRRRAQR